MTRKRWIVALGLVAALGVACGGGDDGGGSGDSGDDGGSSGGGTVTLTAADFEFEPSSLSAAVGDTIEFTNEDDAPHTFTADDAGIDEQVEASGSVSIELADVEPGSYDFICTIHPDMKGTLEVTE